MTLRYRCVCELYQILFTVKCRYSLDIFHSMVSISIGDGYRNQMWIFIVEINLEAQDHFEYFVQFIRWISQIQYQETIAEPLLSAVHPGNEPNFVVSGNKWEKRFCKKKLWFGFLLFFDWLLLFFGSSKSELNRSHEVVAWMIIFSLNNPFTTTGHIRECVPCNFWLPSDVFFSRKRVNALCPNSHTESASNIIL